MLLVFVIVLTYCISCESYKSISYKRLKTFQLSSTSTTPETQTPNSFETVRHFLSKSVVSNKICLLDPALRNEMERSNFWTAGTFVINSCQCVGVDQNFLQFRVHCSKQGKPCVRDVTIPFPVKIDSDDLLKNMLISLARSFNCMSETKAIVELPFGRTYDLPLDFRFNDVPHAQWLRSYVYDSIKSAVIKAIYDKDFPNKAKMQVKFNFPEVNPAFDTYRVGTVLECVRTIALALACDEGKRVRICVQQSLGEGVFTGLPLALASMRPILERMDWGSRLSAEEKAQSADYSLAKGESRSEAMIRLGQISAQDVAPDDDVFIIIAPQNVIGGMIIELLEDMVKAVNGRPMILINPSLGDRPSSNNVMQIRGRAERKIFEESFTDIYELRLLYPSSGGYMFPIRGLVFKKDHEAPWVVYDKGSVGGSDGSSDTDSNNVDKMNSNNSGSKDSSNANNKGREKYDIIAALPTYPTPDRTEISNLFTR